MSQVLQRCHDLGLTLPAPMQLPPGVTLPFPFVRLVGTRAIISGHGPLTADGRVAGPLGAVGVDVSVAEAQASARLTALAVLASLQRALGDLDRIAAWTRVLGYVQCASGFTQQPAVINGFSEVILAVFGAEVGAHARSAIGVSALPFNIPVEVEGEVEIWPR